MMTFRTMGRGASSGLLLAAMLTATGCTDQKPSETQRSLAYETQRSVNETPATPPAVAPVPVPPSPHAHTEAPRTPPPTAARSSETQMQDDAEASGMTSRMPAVTNDTVSSANGNLN